MTGAVCAIGIDPGLAGALAAVQLDGDEVCVLETVQMPVRAPGAGPIGQGNIVDTQALREGLLTLIRATRAEFTWTAIERQQVRPRQQGHLAVGFNYGLVVAVAEELLLPSRLMFVPATMWKAEMGLSSDKRRSLETATGLFGAPAADRHWRTLSREGVAEAALLAYWRARRVRDMRLARERREAEGRPSES